MSETKVISLLEEILAELRKITSQPEKQEQEHPKCEKCGGHKTIVVTYVATPICPQCAEKEVGEFGETDSSVWQ